MCGRYLYDPQTGELNDYYKLAFQMKEPKSGEVFPSEEVVTLGSGADQKIRVALTTWGFTNERNKQRLINARSETVQEKPMFREPFLQHRCLFPMSGFYEWNPEKEKQLFTLPNQEALYVAGLYRVKNEQVESVILTTAPNEIVAPIHDRMPLIIPKDQIRAWLQDTQQAIQLLQKVDTTPLVLAS